MFISYLSCDVILFITYRFGDEYARVIGVDDDVIILVFVWYELYVIVDWRSFVCVWCILIWFWSEFGFFFVYLLGSDIKFSGVVYRTRAYLYFERCVVGFIDGGVKWFIFGFFGVGDVIVIFFFDWVIYFVN